MAVKRVNGRKISTEGADHNYDNWKKYFYFYVSAKNLKMYQEEFLIFFI